MLGAIIGDIVGSRFEWNNHKSKEFDFLTYKCFATDDSIMSLAVAKAILECKDDYTRLGSMTVKYMREIGRPYPTCGFGGRFYQWIYSDDPQPYNSYGNGAAMRVSACGFAANSLDEAVRLSKAVTEVTHNHPEGIKGAEATTAAIYMARSGSSIIEIRDYIDRHYYPMDFTLDSIRETYQFNETCQETVPQAIMAFLESTGFEDAVRNAISIGGDSDTLAAITGSIAEAYYGIPADIRKHAIPFLDHALLKILNEFEAKYGMNVEKAIKCSESRPASYTPVTGHQAPLRGAAITDAVTAAGAAEHSIDLDDKFVAEITGRFFVASYQRGYRWGEIEVRRLLDDLLSNGDMPYCLQPIVVRRDGGRFELIDGQQRLTTLYLLYAYMHRSSQGWMPAPAFSLSYETRSSSQDYLADMDFTREIDDIDYWFMKNAYNTIETWFSERDRVDAANKITGYLKNNVKIIWYEVDETEDAIGLFTRLNIGKILLTNAELVKAMFLNRGTSGMTSEKQDEIALQWDNIERELQNRSLWCFLTNRDPSTSQTHIDLVLDLIASAEPPSRDPYHTFFCFDRMRQDRKLEDIWNEIQHTFLLLKSWYEDHDLYHKIGYLIATGNQLKDLFALSKGKTKRQFHESLRRCIKEGISAGKNHGELRYDSASDQEKIHKLLLLFNVESVRRQEDMQRFPFFRFKSKAWSLEHIHAQHSEGMRTQEKWKLWLEYHLKSLRVLAPEDIVLLADMQEAIDKPKLSEDEFKQLHQRAVSVLSPKGSDNYLHTLANLALLSVEDNAALNNATFDVKRNIIVEMDQAGKYIPFCTRMVFLKYYTRSEDNQIHFWGESDRAAYITKMNEVLEEFLDEKIIIGKEHQ